MTNVALAKFIISSAAGLSSSYIAKCIINNHVVPTTVVEKSMLFVGRFAIGGMVSQAVTTNTHQRLNEIERMVEQYNKGEKVTFSVVE